MAAVTLESMERKTGPLEINIKNRRTTDKYWIVLFVISFIIILVAFCSHATIRRKPYCRIDFDKKAVTYAAYGFFQNNTIREVTWCDRRTTLNTTIEYAYHIWGNNWLFDAVTCNFAFLDAHHEKSGSIIIWVHVLTCVFLIIYAFASMRTDDMYCHQLLMFYLMFLTTTLYTRMMYNDTRFYPDDCFYTLFSLPEIILLITVITKSSIPMEKRTQASGSIETVTASTGSEGRGSIVSILTWCVFPSCFVAHFVCLFCLATSGFELNWNLDWNDSVSYAIAGAGCYLCLTIYYFVSMTMSCSTSLGFDRQDLTFTDLPRAFFIVARYHFGTACYHATLIFPRIHAMLITNEKEFKAISNLSAIDRFYLTHWKIHDLTMMITAARGHNYSGSVRESLRLLASDSPKLKNFQSHSQLFKILTALLLAMNGLTFVSLWAHGVTLGVRLLMGVWVTFLIGIFYNYLITKLFDAVADVIWFLDDGSTHIVY